MNMKLHIPGAALVLLTIALTIKAQKHEDAPMPPSDPAPAAPETVNTEKATLGLGCFWCGEAVFQRLEGVIKAQSGYINGHTKNPTYKQVCEGNTGHAEVIQVTFDPARISFKDILETFWLAHDPTTLNRQGNDVGTQYRSGIFYHSEAQKQVAEASKAKWNAAKKFKDPIVTEITAADTFYPAEDYHEDYYNRNKDAGYCRFVIAPKLKKLGMDD